jgi:hypothetical protein
LEIIIFSVLLFLSIVVFLVNEKGRKTPTAPAVYGYIAQTTGVFNPTIKIL